MHGLYVHWRDVARGGLQTGLGVGTYSTMSPEQENGASNDSWIGGRVHLFFPVTLSSAILTSHLADLPPVRAAVKDAMDLLSATKARFGQGGADVIAANGKTAPLKSTWPNVPANVRIFHLTRLAPALYLALPDFVLTLTLAADVGTGIMT